MKDIIAEIEYISRKMKDLREKYDLNENDSMNLLFWKWHENRKGMIDACRMLGIEVYITDTEGLKWAIRINN